MADNLAKVFAAEDFSPEKFVKDLSAQCVGAEELRQQRAKIQELANSTSAQLKRNVYQNYMQFIETAKEISHLESEMYQLSQLLSEQRSLLSTLGSTRSTGVMFEDLSESQQDNTDSAYKEEEQKQKLIELLENVEGAMNLAEIPGRVCLHEGTLLELDAVDGTPLKRIHAYLFNDILMIASWLSNGSKRGPPRYKMQAVYNLETLAVVNVRDLGTVKLAFKLLAFSDTRVFQCSTATSKKEWLDKCEQAKKAKLAEDNLVDLQDNKKLLKEDKMGPSRSMSLDSNALGMEDDEDSDYHEPPPEWLLEVTEDLDSCIAQRHFEEAYMLLERAKTYLKEAQPTPLLTEIQLKVNNRGRALINVLTKELEWNAEIKSLQGGGLRSARRVVRLLIQLNRSAQACQLYLHLCSVVLKARLKRIQKDGADLVSYVKQLSAIAFSNIMEIAKEFIKIFPKSTNCTSALVVWCGQEVKYLTSHLTKQLFNPQVSLSTLVECIVAVRTHCDQITELGMDFRYQVDGQLRSHLVKAIQLAGDQCTDTVKVRAAEDTWRPTNLQTSQNLQKLLSELDDLGISVPQSYLTNDCWIALTSNTLAFSRLYVSLLEDCLSVATPELVPTIEEVLVSVMHTQIQHIVASLTNPKLKQEKKLVQSNAIYLRDVIIARGLELYKSVTNQQFTKLSALKEHIVIELLSPTKPKAAPRTSIPKYSTTEYL